MGMFDTVKLVGHTLPDEGDQYRETEWWQTKDFDCVMEIIRIQNGRLVRDRWHYEDVPKAERPYPDAPDDSLLSLAGSIRTVIDEADVDMNFHGCFNFYTYVGDPNRDDGKWFEYQAKFTDGNLVSITRVDPDHHQ